MTPADVQDALPAVISALTTVRQQDEAATARPALRREIAATPAPTALVDALVDARLLVSDEGTEGAPMVRFAHEALLSQWPLAREIIAANREFLATRSRVRADAKRWLAEGKNPDLLLPPGKRLAEAEELRCVPIVLIRSKFWIANFSARAANSRELGLDLPPPSRSATGQSPHVSGPSDQSSTGSASENQAPPMRSSNIS